MSFKDSTFLATTGSPLWIPMTDSFTYHWSWRGGLSSLSGSLPWIIYTLPLKLTWWSFVTFWLPTMNYLYLTIWSWRGGLSSLSGSPPWIIYTLPLKLTWWSFVTFWLPTMNYLYLTIEADVMVFRHFLASPPWIIYTLPLKLTWWSFVTFWLPTMNYLYLTIEADVMVFRHFLAPHHELSIPYHWSWRDGLSSLSGSPPWIIYTLPLKLTWWSFVTFWFPTMNYLYLTIEADMMVFRHFLVPHHEFKWASVRADICRHWIT